MNCKWGCRRQHGVPEYCTHQSWQQWRCWTTDRNVCFWYGIDLFLFFSLSLSLSFSFSLSFSLLFAFHTVQLTQPIHRSYIAGRPYLAQIRWERTLPSVQAPCLSFAVTAWYVPQMRPSGTGSGTVPAFQLKVQVTWNTCCLFLVVPRPSPKPDQFFRLFRVDPSRSWTQWWEWTSPHQPPSQLRIWITQPETQNIQISGKSFMGCSSILRSFRVVSAVRRSRNKRSTKCILSCGKSSHPDSVNDAQVPAFRIVQVLADTQQNPRAVRIESTGRLIGFYWYRIGTPMCPKKVLAGKGFRKLYGIFCINGPILACIVVF